jgi:Domain of unknown function (DUF222)/HNH endonuclease
MEIVTLEAQITELVGHLNSANYRLLSLLAEFDRRRGWADSATQSCAHWLNWKCGIDMGAAREKVRTALALESLPRISAAMERGELSYSKVRAITRVADAATEELLLSIALHGTAHHVENTVRWFRRVKQTEELSREARQQAARHVAFACDVDGSFIVKASLPAEAGALFKKAIDLAADAAFREGRTNANGFSAEEPAVKGSAASASAAAAATRGVSAETSAASDHPAPGEWPTLGVRRADALARIAESFLAHGADVLASGERHHVVVHVDAQTLRDGCSGRCEHEHGPSLPAETVRRLGCDASVVAIVEDENGEPLNVGRKTRTIPPAIRRALFSRDKDGCRFPGCTNRHYVDGHHIKHWANGGETRLSNLVVLCRFHHRLVHEGGVDVKVLDDGALRFVVKGRSFDSPVPARHAAEQRPPNADTTRGTWAQLVANHGVNGITITPDTAVTRWRGERMDYGIAVEVLMDRMRRAALRQGVSAETRAR